MCAYVRAHVRFAYGCACIHVWEESADEEDVYIYTIYESKLNILYTNYTFYWKDK